MTTVFPLSSRDTQFISEFEVVSCLFVETSNRYVTFKSRSQVVFLNERSLQTPVNLFKCTHFIDRICCYLGLPRYSSEKNLLP